VLLAHFYYLNRYLLSINPLFKAPAGADRFGGVENYLSFEHFDCALLLRYLSTSCVDGMCVVRDSRCGGFAN